MKLELDLKKIKKVPIEQVKPNTWNPKEKDTKEYKKIVEGIKLKGLRGFIPTRRKDDYNEIIDGEQRYTAANELGFKEIYIYDEGEMSDKEAQELTVWYQQQVPFDLVSEAQFINALVLKYDKDLELPYTELELEEMRNLAEFDFSDYDSEQELEDEDVRTLSIKMHKDKYDIVMSAINSVRAEHEVDEARAIELICADYMAGK